MSVHPSSFADDMEDLQWWFQILSSGGHFVDENLCRFIQVRLTMLWRNRVVPNFVSSTGVFMDDIIVGPSKQHVCLGYGGRQNGFKVRPL